LIRGYYESASPASHLMLRSNGEYRYTVLEPLRAERGTWTATDRELRLAPSGGGRPWVLPYKVEETRTWKALVTPASRFIRVEFPDR
jgi:hypothetical protein